MRFGYIRAIAYATVIFATAVALTFIPALPDSRPAELLFSQAASPSWKLRFDTLGRGENLARVLKRGGLSDSAIIAAIRATPEALDHRALPVGVPIEIRAMSADSAPSEVVIELNPYKRVLLKRNGADWVGSEEAIPWTTDTIVVAGTIRSNLYEAMDQAAGDFLPKAARHRLTDLMADEVYGYKIDMTRELQRGDEFKVLAERSMGPRGAVRIGKIIASTFNLSGSELKAVRFSSATGGGDYFDDQGKSMQAMFRMYPVDFARITSNFGMRRHPILGNVRAHKGTDYGAASGTPIKALGDGTVIKSGWGNGYGNMIEIRHPNGYVTRYGHMRAFAKGIRGGSRVKMGDVIGYVGMTGLATAPHLHFEVLVNGVQRDSRSAIKRSSGAPIARAEAEEFQRVRDMLLGRLEGTPVNTAASLSTFRQ